MTREHRLVFGLEEIKAVRWQCGNCRAAVSYQLDESLEWPETCPNCHKAQLDPGFKAGHRAFTDFVAAIKAVRRAQIENKNLPVTLQFEIFDDPARG